LLTKKALAHAASGDIIEVKIDNPTSLEAVIAMIPDFSGTHLGTIKGNRGWQVIVRKL
jgi:tRNA 2-thiouridine synthesizing protein A